MKAAVVVANEDVQYQEIEEPKVTKGAVKIKVRYSGICGSDIPRVLNHGVHICGALKVVLVCTNRNGYVLVDVLYILLIFSVEVYGVILLSRKVNRKGEAVVYRGYNYIKQNGDNNGRNNKYGGHSASFKCFG